MAPNKNARVSGRCLHRRENHEAAGPAPPSIGLESVKKNQQVATRWNWTGGPSMPCPVFRQQPCASKPMRAFGSGKA
jgi:hypothetical protein